MTPIEARQKAKAYDINAEADRLIIQVKEDIAKRASKGKFDVYMDIKSTTVLVDDIIANRLKAEGYRIELTMIGYIIHWDEPEEKKPNWFQRFVRWSCGERTL